MDLNTVAMRAAKEICPKASYYMNDASCSQEECSADHLCEYCYKYWVMKLKHYADIIEKHMKEANFQTVTAMQHIVGFRVRKTPHIPKGEIWMNNEDFEPPKIPEDLIEMMKGLTDEFQNKK